MFRRRRRVLVQRYDNATNRWAGVDDAGAVDRDELTLSTFNVWFDSYFAAERYQAIADLLSRDRPDIMVFQEITPEALRIFLAQPWIRADYRSAAVAGGDAGNYGMLMLSRLPIANVAYTRLPTHLDRGYLRAELTLNGRALSICSIHLESGKRTARLRARQLRRVFRALRSDDNVVVLGDFNMRDEENARITPPYRDVWPMLRPGEDGFTEDTSINLMRFDSKNKYRQVRFDRVLLKGWSWVATSIELLGTTPISSAHPRVFPSDHFGVHCRVVRRRDDLPADLGDQKFVSLTSFKRNGEPVASPMWIARDGDQLVAWTPADAWKVRRIRRDPRVTLAPCGRTGKVAPGAPVLAGEAEVVSDPQLVARVDALIKQKYGLGFRAVTLLETIAARGRKPRVALVISPRSPQK